MLRPFRVCLLMLLMLSSACLKAQQFGGNPTYIKWRQINTDTVRIIFPEGLEDAARRVASVVHELQRNHTATIGKRLRKINLVLQNQSTVSNAYVGLGPYRSEFYLFAPQNTFELGALQWTDNLSVHEWRHVQQYSNFNVGLSRLAHTLFGDQGQALANAAAVPDWFFEGDAVFSETSLTTQGRGRLPDFFNGFQALYRQNKKYNYMKLRNGSYRHYVPGHYELGYMLVGYGRQKYGADFWKKVSHDAAAFKPLFYPWQGAFKKYAGIPYMQFVNEALAFYNNKWEQAKGNVGVYLTPARKNVVTDYKYPYLDSNGSIIVLKRSYLQVPAFYRINPDGIEEKIGVSDISNDDYYSYRNGKLVYASLKADRRWGYREYSDIRIMDASSGQSKKITSKQRFFSPDISHDGLKVLAVEMKTNQVSQLVMVDLAGQTLFRSKAMRGIVYTHPKFSSTDNYAYTAVRNEDGKMALMKVDLNSGVQTMLLPFSNRIIGFPVVQNDTILFTNTYRGSDEVWAYVEDKKQLYRVAVNPTGYYQGVYDGTRHRLIASNFTTDGYRLATIDSSGLLWAPVEEKENALPDMFIPKALQQENKQTLENIVTRNFPIEKYRSHNILNFHSYRPYYDDPEVSFGVLGENILNTLQTEILYTYNRNERSHRLSLSTVYGGWYLQPLLSVSNTWRRPILGSFDTTFDELRLRAGLQLPLNFTSGKQYRFLTLTGTFNNNHVTIGQAGKSLYGNSSVNYWEGQLFYSGQTQQALQHIYTHWGQTLLLQYRTLSNQSNVYQLLASFGLYLPGVYPSHNIVLTAAYQQRDTMRVYNYSNSFPFSRGYPGLDYPRMWKLGVNYHLPLLYPDWGFANIVYFKRIRGNGFYDVSRIKSLRTGNEFDFRTTGGEVFFDTRWWNQYDVSFGVRYSHLHDNKLLGITNPNVWEFIVPVGLFR